MPLAFAADPATEAVVMIEWQDRRRGGRLHQKSQKPVVSYRGADRPSGAQMGMRARLSPAEGDGGGEDGRARGRRSAGGKSPADIGAAVKEALRA
jgi:succinyl-CoA synthetase alpha subunit